MSRNFPPSLNKTDGKSDTQLKEERIIAVLNSHVAALTTRTDFEPEEHGQQILTIYFQGELRFKAQKKRAGGADLAWRTGLRAVGEAVGQNARQSGANDRSLRSGDVVIETNELDRVTLGVVQKTSGLRVAIARLSHRTRIDQIAPVRRASRSRPAGRFLR